GDGRGQAPGRAGAARVQPPARARHVAAPRAPRRRHRRARGRSRDARPRRVAAGDRPPDRAPADRTAAQATRRAAETAPSAATLEETLLADLVLHVVEGSAPYEQLKEMAVLVESVLAEIGAGELPVEIVVNKIDRVDPLGRRRLANRFPDALQVSALTGEGLDDLKSELAQRFEDRWERVRLLVPYDEGGRLHELYALGTPIEEREDTPDGVLV